jgi:hypothetical protein
MVAHGSTGKAGPVPSLGRARLLHLFFKCAYVCTCAAALIVAGAMLDAVARWPAHQQERAGAVALVVAGAVLDAVASSTSKGGPVLSPWSWLRSASWPVPCLIRWPYGQLHQRSWAGAAALVVIVAGVLAGAVLDPMPSSTSSTSKSGPVLLSWL